MAWYGVDIRFTSSWRTIEQQVRQLILCDQLLYYSSISSGHCASISLIQWLCSALHTRQNDLFMRNELIEILWAILFNPRHRITCTIRSRKSGSGGINIHCDRWVGCKLHVERRGQQQEEEEEANRKKAGKCDSAFITGHLPAYDCDYWLVGMAADCRRWFIVEFDQMPHNKWRGYLATAWSRQYATDCSYLVRSSGTPLPPCSTPEYSNGMVVSGALSAARQA
jgi:hypothetical protein